MFLGHPKVPGSEAEQKKPKKPDLTKLQQTRELREMLALIDVEKPKASRRKSIRKSSLMNRILERDRNAIDYESLVDDLLLGIMTKPAVRSTEMLKI